MTESKPETNGILRAAWLIAVITILSKFIGFLRDMVLAGHYGASTVSDAYFYANQIPSLAIILLGGVGGPFHSATVSVFSKMIPNLNLKPQNDVNKLYSTFFTGTFILFGLASVLCYVYAPQIMSFIISNGSPELISLSVQHFKIMSPVILFGGIIGIYYGLLVCYKQFTLPNISPIVLSLVIIVAVLLCGNDPNGLVLAWATTIGGLLQLIVQYPKLRQIGFRVKPNFEFFNNPQFKTLCELLFPAVLSSTIGQINIYIDMFFASSLREGAWTAVVYANRIFQFPVGILVTAFLVPLFPLFSRYVADNDFDGIRRYFNKGVGVLFFMSIPITIGKLLNKSIVEPARIEFKENWNPDETLKTITAFANDTDNWRGGYIVISIKENQGQIDLLNSRLNINEIDNIQKDILRYCNFLKSKYIPETELANYKGKNLLLVWCPGGYDRPYLCLEKPSAAHSKRTYI